MADQIDELSVPHLEMAAVLGENRVNVRIFMRPTSYESHPFLSDLFPILQNGKKVMSLADRYPQFSGFLRRLEFHLRTGEVRNPEKGNSSNMSQEVRFDLS